MNTLKIKSSLSPHTGGLFLLGQDEGITLVHMTDKCGIEKIIMQAAQG